ncbi:conjugal transfer protein TraH [Thioalkalivibrio thiocyanodenitrificans]|uniref:conjugal transfer protein TraH n=1 Tax=Thioalkalivibrio thiocyanodenitrificans TaxID=243063 RepID=UPI000362D68C|nr:conjugal transfer protein TraH [Thioalkalivibrio thiocyanodenitrificans]
MAFGKLIRNLMLGAVLAFACTFPAHAQLGSAFGSLLQGANVSTQNPGSYQSQARNSFVLGGAGVRFPSSNVQLFSITPPNVSAGCGGIDMFFGGLSFINAEQFQQLIRDIGQATLGYVVMLALKQLCPQCEAVIQALQRAAAMANAMAVDSCQVGQSIARRMMGDPMGDDNVSSQAGVEAICGQEYTGLGEGWSSVMSVIGGVCNSMKRASQALHDFVQNNPRQREALTGLVGNSTWNALRAMGFEHDPEMAELLMSMVGTSVMLPDMEEPRRYPPLLTDPEQAVAVFMCGYIANSDFPERDKFCQSHLGSVGSVGGVYHCGTSTGARATCMTVQQLGLTQWVNQVSDRVGHGFILNTYNTLMSAVQKARAGQALAHNEIALIATAPLPLYKVINFAAVYPGVAEQMIQNNAFLLAYLFADAYVRHLMLDVRRHGRETAISGSLIRALHEFQMDMLDGMDSNMAMFDDMLARQQTMLAQIQRVERVMQDTIWSRGLMGNQEFAYNVTRQMVGN